MTKLNADDGLGVWLAEMDFLKVRVTKIANKVTPIRHPPTLAKPYFISLRPHLSLFSSLEYSGIRNSSSVAAVEMFSTSQVTARAR